MRDCTSSCEKNMANRVALAESDVKVAKVETEVKVAKKVATPQTEFKRRSG